MEAISKRNGAAVLIMPRPPAGGIEAPIAIGEPTARLLGAVAVLAVGFVHILDAASTYHTTRWIFWAYVLLIAASVPVALFLLHWASPLAWLGAIGLALGPFLGYLWSRSIGLPGDAPDVGNWLCTLGMAALFVETAVLALGLTRLRLWKE